MKGHGSRRFKFGKLKRFMFEVTELFIIPKDGNSQSYLVTKIDLLKQKVIQVSLALGIASGRGM